MKGTLPMNLIDTWRLRKCDLNFTVKRMGSRPLSSCLDSDLYDWDIKKDSNKKRKKEKLTNLNENLPLISIMAAATTRRVTKPSTSNLALFMYLLPSLMR